MLLAGLKGKHIAALAACIYALAYYTAGEFTHIFLPAGHKAYIRASVADRDTQGLPVTHGNVCTPFSGSLKDRKSGRVAVFDKKGTGSVNSIGNAAQILHHAVTAVSQISYLSLVKGTVLTATAEMIKDGRRTCFFQVTVTDDLGNLIAIANTTGMHV